MSWGRLWGLRRVCGYELELKAEEGFCIYRRSAGGGSGVRVRRLLSPCSRVEVWPLYPVLYPERITSYIMVKLPEPVVVEANARIRFTVLAPFEVGVYAGGTLIDYYPSTGNAKYALYGSPTRGVIARYLEAQLASSQQDTPQCLAPLVVTVENRFSRAVAVERVVFPAQGERLPVKDGRARFPEVRVVVTSPYTALVVVGPDEAGASRLRGATGRSMVMSYGL